MYILNTSDISLRDPMLLFFLIVMTLECTERVGYILKLTELIIRVRI